MNTRDAVLGGLASAALALGVVTVTQVGGSTTVAPLRANAAPSPLLFDGNFETPVISGQTPPWPSVPQCLNFHGQLTTVRHYPGDLYFDSGGALSTTPGGLFNAGSAARVPPGAGLWSGRIVLPVTPAGHTRTNCDLQGYQNAVSTAGQDRYYGLMFYVPTGETLSNSDFSGDNLWEFHFNGVWGAPIAWQLHTGGTSGVNGTADSVVLAIQTGACNNANSPSPGCAYRSNAGNAHSCTGTNPNPTPNSPHCYPAFYAIPPGRVQYGVWNELVMHLHEASDSSGVIQTWFKTKSQSTWTAGANITGIPTSQWDVNRGCCGFPNKELLEQYTAPVTRPFSVNLDNQEIGTTLASVEGQMPGPSTSPPTSSTTTSPTSTTTPTSTSSSTSTGVCVCSATTTVTTTVTATAAP